MAVLAAPFTVLLSEMSVAEEQGASKLRTSIRSEVQLAQGNHSISSTGEVDLQEKSRGLPPDRDKFLGGIRPDPLKGEAPLCSSLEQGSFVRKKYADQELNRWAKKLKQSESEEDQLKSYEYGTVLPLLFSRIHIHGIDIFFDPAFNNIEIKNKNGGPSITVTKMNDHKIRVTSISEEDQRWVKIYSRDDLIIFCGAFDELASDAQYRDLF